MITGLNSPLQTNKWETFKDWVCHYKETNYSLISYINDKHEQDLNSLNFHEVMSYSNSVMEQKKRKSSFCASLLSFPKTFGFSTDTKLFLLCAALLGVSGLVLGYEGRRIILNFVTNISKACVNRVRKFCNFKRRNLVSYDSANYFVLSV